MCSSMIDRTWRYCCGLPCCNCDCPCCSTNQCQEITCELHCCEPELDEDYEPGNIQEVKVVATPKIYTCDDLDRVCLVCCTYLCCVPCTTYICKKCSNSPCCPRSFRNNCFLAKDRDILREMEVLENSIPGAYRKSSSPQKMSKDSHLYPKESTGKTCLVSPDNNSLHGNDSKTSSLRSKAESDEEEINREDGHYRYSNPTKKEITISAVIEQPRSVGLGNMCTSNRTETIESINNTTCNDTESKTTKKKTRKIAKKMDSIDFDELVASDSDSHDKSGYHGNKAKRSQIKVSYRDVCTNGVEIIVTDYDYGKKRSDSISSESSIENLQNGGSEEIDEQEIYSSSESEDIPEDKQCSEDMYKPVVIETRNILITNHRQTSV